MRGIVLSSLVFVALALPASAEEGGIPRLGGHEFVPVVAITEPFLTTYVQTEISLGQTMDSTVALISPQDSTTIGFVEADQLLTSLTFLYQQRVQDWLVVRVNMGFIGSLGTDTSTLVANGITGAMTYEIGWMMRIFQSESTLLSGSIALGSGSATFISPLEWAYSLLEGEEAQLTRSRSSLTGSGGLHGAWALNRRFGLLGSAKASYGESYDGRGDNTWQSDVRLAVSYDLAQDLHVPLGLALTGGRFENDVNSNSEVGTWLWNLRFAVKGRSDFTIGVQTGMSYFDSADEGDKFKIFQIAIDMRYYY